MLKRISLMTVTVLALGACTGLEGARKPNPVPAPDHTSSQLMSIGQARMLAMEPFAGTGRWYAVINYANGTEPVLISEPSSASPDRRLVRLKPESGYVVSRVRMNCPRGGYVVRDAREADEDKDAPGKNSAGTPNLPLHEQFAKLCDRSAKVPTFESRLEGAVLKLRRMSYAMDPDNARPSPDQKPLELKEKGPPIKTQDLRRK